MKDKKSDIKEMFFMFKFGKKKNASEFMKEEEGVIKAVATLDLRNYSPESLAKIKVIKAVALILLPEDASCEFNDAYNAISKNAVASELRVSANAKVENFNGKTILNSQTVSDDSICIINGIGVIMDMENIRCKVMINGVLYMQKGSGAEILNANGTVHILDFKAVKTYDEIEINDDFIRAADEGTLVIADKIVIDNTVKNDILLESGMSFAAGKITCSAAIYGTVARKSVADKIIKK